MTFVAFHLTGRSSLYKVGVLEAGTEITVFNHSNLFHAILICLPAIHGE